MNTKHLICPSKRLARSVQFILILIFSLFIQYSAKAEIVQLSITGYWSERDIKVTDRSHKSYDIANPKFDGMVFGIAPAAGSVDLKLLVDTDDSVFFPQGSQFANRVLAHDLYCYQRVTLVGDSFSFGNAVWRSNGILSGSKGPGSVKVALSTDADITKKDPTRVSFRMFGKADGLNADLFISTSPPPASVQQFLLWEYYAGEEIRSNKYTVKVTRSAQ